MYSIAVLAAGLSLFLYGMQRSEKGLKLLAGTRTRQIVGAITKNRFSGMLAGLLLTFGTQSSSATTVILVGFATAGLISLAQSVGVLLGTSIGTTITVQLFAWKVTRIAPTLISIGFLLYATGHGTRRKRVGQLLFGFGLVFLGMTFMGEAVAPLRASKLFGLFLGSIDSHIGLFVLSAVFTAIIQSSAATIAIVIALASTTADSTTVLLSVGNAVPLILGANVGTAATALIASISSNVSGKRVAWAHAVYKTIAAILALPFAPLLLTFGQWSAPGREAAQIANIHTVYNIGAAIIFLPFTSLLARLVSACVKGKKDERDGYRVRFIDRDFSDHPYLALAQAKKEIVRMSGVVTDMLEKTWQALDERKAELVPVIKSIDDKVDYLHERISPYLTTLSEDEMQTVDSQKQSMLLAVASELELIGDVISKDVSGSVSQLLGSGLAFSAEGKTDLYSFYEKVRMNLYAAIDAFASENYQTAQTVRDKKQAIDLLQVQLRNKHFKRLKSGLRESRETTSIHLDVMEDFRRINSHAARMCAILKGHRRDRYPNGVLPEN